MTAKRTTFGLFCLICLTVEIGAVLQWNTSYPGFLPPNLNVKESVQAGVSVANISCYDDSTTSKAGIILDYGDGGQDFITLFFANRFHTSPIALQRPLDFEAAFDRNTFVFSIECRKAGSTSIFYVSNLGVVDVNDNDPIFVRSGGTTEVYSTKIDEVQVLTDAGGNLIYDQVIVEDIDGVDNNKVTPVCLSLKYVAANPFFDEVLKCEDYFRIVADPIDPIPKDTDQNTTGIIRATYRFNIFAIREDYTNFVSMSLEILAMNVPASPDEITRNSSSANVNIGLIEVQNEVPFLVIRPLTMYEDLPAGIAVQADREIIAYDLDEGDPNPVGFELTPNPDDPEGIEYFMLGSVVPPGPGEKEYRVELLLKKEIDLEQLTTPGDTVYVNITAYEIGNSSRNPMNTTARIIVTVLDVNDNRPEFSQPSYTALVNEQIGGPVAGETQLIFEDDSIIIVSDPDGPGFNTFGVSILPSANSNLFALDRTSGSGTGFFTLRINNTALDFEKDSNQLSITLLAVDSNRPDFTSTANVFVEIINRNDIAPEFGNDTYSFIIPEDTPVGTIVGIVTATDDDAGLSGEIAEYIIQDNTNTFRIAENGSIILNKTVDFENRTTYQFSVSAIDGDPTNPLEASATVRVGISNVIDTRPTFIRDYSTTNLEESLDLQPQVTVQVDNRELNTAVVFSIISVVPQTINVNQYFTIGRNTGEFLLIRELDHRNTDNGLLRVLVRASLDVPGVNLFSESYINVTVQNLNNDDPVFVPVAPNNVYYSNVSEVAPKGYLVFDFNATDSDEPNTLSSTVQFRIQSGGSSFFGLNETTGVLTVVDSSGLSLEVQSIYEIVVQAYDLGTPRRSASATVMIRLLDANNQAPVFIQQVYLFQVNATQAIDSVIDRVNATDVDANSLISYSINVGSAVFDKNDVPISPSINILNVIKIEEFSGVIRVAGDLNRNLYDRIRFNVMAEDVRAEQGQQTATASVVISIVAEPDPRPYFDPPWSFANPVLRVIKTETDRINDTIIPLEATDPLTSRRMNNFTKVPSSDAGDYFAVFGKRLVTKKPLDFEVLETDPNGLKLLSVVVLAITDSGDRSSNATIIVQVADANDNEPIFFNPDPRDDSPTYRLNVAENAGKSTIVGSITVTDADSGTFGLSNFTIEGDTDGIFILERSERSTDNVAQIKLLADNLLDREELDTYSFLLIAEDNNGDRGNRAIATVIVTVDDVNDNRPKFGETSYFFEVIGTVNVGYNISLVLAEDPDFGVGGLISYSIPDPRATEYFNIRVEQQVSPLTSIGVTQQLGQIYVTQSLLQIPDGTRFNFTVMARDGGSLTSSVPVTILVNQPGQSPNPIWDGNLVANVQILENSTIGTFVASITANPAKPLEPGAGITYSLITDLRGDYDLFSIDNRTGEIVTKGLLSYNKFNTDLNFKNLQIKATDLLNSSFTSQFLLVVEIIDIDDNLPTFQNCTDRTYPIPVRVTVKEAQPEGEYVYRAEGCDDDQAPHNRIVYREFAPSTDSPYYELCPDQNALFNDVFELNEDTGIILTRSPLDREMRAEYDLCVQALAPGNLRKKRGVSNIGLALELHDVLFIRVIVLDENDNGPLFNETLVRTVILNYLDGNDVSVSEAYDLDLSPNNKILYSIQDIFFYYGGDRPISSPAAFTINGETGAISVSLRDYTQFAGGYFEINVTASDFSGGNDFLDWQIQKIYVTKPLNRIRVVLDRPADSGLNSEIQEMIRRLNEVEDGVYYEEMKTSYHVINNEQDPVFDRTDVCLVIVRDDTVEQSADAIKFLESQNAVLAILDEYGARDPGPCDPAKSVYPEGWESYWWVLVAFAIFIFVCVLILIFIILSLYSGYKRYMDTRRTYLVPGN